MAGHFDVGFNPSPLIALSNTLLEEYVKLRRQEAPGIIVSKKTRDCVAKAAKLCVSNKLDPVQFVRAQKYYCKMPGFFPTALTASQALENYHKYVKGVKKDLNSVFHTQCTYLTKAVEAGGYSLEEALMNDGIDLKPWFRILITRNPIPEVIQKYRKAAVACWDDEYERFAKSKNLDTTRITSR